MATGKIGVSTQDLFPIIKKFLYSDHEIFLREIVSNAVDASQKLRTLAQSGEFKGSTENLKIQVTADKTAGTLTVSDNGIGMTAEEVKKYINQIAFSGAEEFVEKYKDNAQAIIGHFGLGFYSAFMVSDKVELVTKSYKEDAQAVKWSCKGDTQYTMGNAERAEHGTDVIMYINKEDEEFLNEDKIRSLLNKYCKFLPVEIICGDEVINETHPAWTRKPSELTEEDYSKFYHTLYPMAADPLFHIHLNVDYPFTLTGILYFPKITQKLEVQRNKIQLYCNQVFVTDSVEGIVPDYLTLLHGVIDSPDIPLNVSRSYLQSDRNVKKISNHITKKVADSLHDIFKNNRADYDQKWDDLKLFIQYGILSDEKFSERALPILLYKDTEGRYFTAEEYENAVKENQTDKEGNVVVLYTSNKEEQYAYIQKAKDKGYSVLVMDGYLDTPMINSLEQKNPKVRYARVDADVLEKLIQKEEAKESHFTKEEKESLEKIVKEELPKEGAIFMVQFEALGENGEPMMITRSEFMRRMKDMATLNPEMNFYGQMGEQFNVVVNSDHKLVQQILSEEKQDAQKAKKISGQLVDLALLANGLLKGEALNRFVKRSVDLL